MTAMRARRQLVAVMIIAFGFGFSQAAANELNDSIQLFHQGDYRSAYDGLSALVQRENETHVSTIIEASLASAKETERQPRRTSKRRCT